MSKEGDGMDSCVLDRRRMCWTFSTTISVHGQEGGGVRRFRGFEGSDGESRSWWEYTVDV